MDAPERIIKSHNDWARSAKQLQVVLFILGFCSVTASVVVAVFMDSLGPFGTRLVATISALSVGYLSFFQVPKKLSDLWRGWRYLNAALVLFETGKIDIEKLTSEYARAEEMVGVMEADSSSIKPMKGK